ncbi:hypothetical protein EDD85DRAFT_836076 [Armillaria nabsnona]|nr:hypothetical protein EDD85DRAFT_836076 [Armillaria nabsnona]
MTIIFKFRKKPGHKGKGPPPVNSFCPSTMSRNQHRRRLVIPSDIFTEIAQYLHPDVTEGGQAALASLTLASRRVHEAVDKELYAAPRLSDIMQWVQFLDALRRTGEPDIERRVRRLYLTGPTSGFGHRFATRDATFVPPAIDILKGCTNAKQVTVTYHPRTPLDPLPPPPRFFPRSTSTARRESGGRYEDRYVYILLVFSYLPARQHTKQCLEPRNHQMSSATRASK